MIRSVTTRAAVGFTVAGALVLAACSSPEPSDDARVTEDSHVAEEVPSTSDAPVTSDSDLVRDPVAGTNPPVYDDADLTLPTQSEGGELVAPGWIVPPQHLDGIFMAPVEVDGHLEFTAIDATGQALWTVERPLSCTGFTLTYGANGPIAVINDAMTTDTALAATSASAYDLLSGELVWGPVEVPGPHQGPGLVYAAPSAEAMGASGPRVALSPDTGEIVADEAESDWSVVAESRGTVLLANDQSLRALNVQGAELWESDLPEGLTTVHPAASTSSGPGVQALRADDGGLVVLDLGSGAVLADSVTSAVIDESIGMLITTSASHTQGTMIATGEEQWSTDSSDQAYVVAAGGAMAYVRDGDAIRVHNTITGDVTPGYPELLTGTIAVPYVMTGTGVAAYPYEGQVLLATEPPQ